MKIVSKEIDIGGRKLRLEAGRLAPQADASVIAQYGETMVLVTVVRSSPREDLDYFPLSVEYVERLYAGGRIKGSRWVKREGRPSDESVLIGRLVDRSIRPLFPKNYFDEVQVTITVLSVDLENDPDILSVIATSAALAISEIPWNGPIGAIKVGLKENIPFANPVEEEKKFSDIELVISSTKDRVIMLEAKGNEVPEETVLEAIKFGKQESLKVIDLIEDLQKEVGKTKISLTEKELDPQVKTSAQKFVKKYLEEVFGKAAESGDVLNSSDSALKLFLEDFERESAPAFAEATAGKKATADKGSKKEAVSAFTYYWKKIFREKVLEGNRIDGRALTEIRPISAEVGILPRTHGSAVFRRGLTQVLTVTTLGAPSLHQLIESATGEESKRYIHHYFMPPYSSGEVGRIGNLSRREIGHGALAEKALEAVVPSDEKFPYTVRVVSEVMSSNGSTSMASTCGSCLSLMDAGVPITSPVSGIAMGLVTGEKQGTDGKYVVLSDIAGAEDFNGDMDFKIAGSAKGITAIQMDVKIPGLTDEMLKKIFEQGKEGRLSILEKMLAVLDKPRQKLSQYAPRVAVLHIDPSKIGEVIGPGGRVIRGLIERTGANIEVEDDGSINITGVSDDSVTSAINQINGLTAEAVIGQVYEGVVKRIQPFGAFVEILPGKEGLVHVSKMAAGFIDDPNKVVSLDQKVQVKVSEIDERGRINLTMLLNDEKKEEAPHPRRDFNRGGFSGYSSRPRFKR